MSHRSTAPAFYDRLHGLRIENISASVSTEDVVAEFEGFGVIGDVYRPTDMGISLVEKTVLFIRYFSEEDANNALFSMNGAVIGGQAITVTLAKQDSLFTNSTGYISNWDIKEKPRDRPYFDPNMPDSHRQKQYEERIKLAENAYTLKVENLTNDITVEDLQNIFDEFGTIPSIYYPTDLKTMKSKSFAFIRYLKEDHAIKAMETLQGVPLGAAGYELLITMCSPPRYFSNGRGPPNGVPRPRKSNAVKFEIPI